MALLFLDGFDHYGVSENITAAGFGKWLASSSGSHSSNAQVRTGTGSLGITTFTTIDTKILPASGGVVFGMALYSTSTLTNQLDVVEVRENSIQHIIIRITSSGTFQIRNASGVTLATGTKVLNISTWYYLEFKIIIHGTTGTYELKIDGVTDIIGTGANTQNGGTGQWNNIRLLSITHSNAYYDDLYICDTSGSAPRNTFLGPVKIETLMPQTDAVAAGSNAGLTPSTGTDHGALVDEIPPNTTDYNKSSTVGVKDTYNYPSMALTGTIMGIQTNLYVAKSDISARTVCGVIRIGSTDYDGATLTPTTGFQYQSEVRPVNPNGSIEWTVADVNSIQVGMKIVS